MSYQLTVNQGDYVPQENRPLKILIIDDSKMIRTIIKNNFENRGYNFIEAESGEQALQILQATMVDIVLLDQCMIGLTGMETFEKIKKMMPDYPPVIMITADSTLELVVTFLKAGGRDFAQKPLDLDTLYLKIERTIETEKLLHKKKIELQRVEKELLKLSHAVEYSPGVVVIVDIQGEIEYVNPKFTKITGYLPEEVMGKTLRILKSDKHDKEFYEKLWKTLLLGNDWYGTFCNKKKNGELYWEKASISAMKDHNGNITHWVKVAEDITESKRIEENLKASEESLRKLLDFSPMAKAISDGHGNIEYINQSFSEIFGYTLEDVPTIDSWFVRAYPDPEYRAKTMVGWQAAIEKSKDKSGRINAGESRVTSKNGSILVIEIIGTLINDKIFFVFNDLTKRKQAENSLKEAKKIAEQANKAKSDFIASMSMNLGHP